MNTTSPPIAKIPVNKTELIHKWSMIACYVAIMAIMLVILFTKRNATPEQRYVYTSVVENDGEFIFTTRMDITTGQTTFLVNDETVKEEISLYEDILKTGLKDVIIKNAGLKDDIFQTAEKQKQKYEQGLILLKRIRGNWITLEDFLRIREELHVELKQ